MEGAKNYKFNNFKLPLDKFLGLISYIVLDLFFSSNRALIFENISNKTPY
jgi:hypothetical protein